ncbi:MAG: phosphate signaling complex protein PhoU [Gammaproteobacteria bacterium]|jgi:phosphate transport system protein
MVVTHQSLSQDEKDIHLLIHEIGRAVYRAFQHATDAFLEYNAGLAAEVIDGDAEINAICARIEEKCFVTIALRQPVASDLRDLLASMHIAQEYERIGDYAADIARKVLEVSSVPRKECRDDFQLLTDLCMLMLRQVRDLLEKPDEEAARTLAAEDDKVDEAEKHLVQNLIRQMRDEPSTIENCVSAIAVAHKMERIADRITNIAEQIIFSASGKTVELG